MFPQELNPGPLFAGSVGVGQPPLAVWLLVALPAFDAVMAESLTGAAEARVASLIRNVRQPLLTLASVCCRVAV